MAWWALDINELAWLDASIHHNTNAILNKKGKHVRKLSAKVFLGILLPSNDLKDHGLHAKKPQNTFALEKMRNQTL